MTVIKVDSDIYVRKVLFSYAYDALEGSRSFILVSSMDSDHNTPGKGWAETSPRSHSCAPKSLSLPAGGGTRAEEDQDFPCLWGAWL